MLWVLKSFEYPQNMFWLRNKKFDFFYTLLTKGLASMYGCVCLSGPLLLADKKGPNKEILCALKL